MKKSYGKYLGAILPLLLLGGPNFASSARSVSRFRPKALAVQSEAAAEDIGSASAPVAASAAIDPFAVFGAETKPAMAAAADAGQEVMDFLKNNDLLRSGSEAASGLSGELSDFTGRKDFADARSYGHCHIWGWVYHSGASLYGTPAACASAGGTWDAAATAPLFENTWVANRASTSFDLNVDLNKACTVYAVLVSASAAAPNSTQVKNGTDGGGTPAIQTKTLPVSASPYTGVISFTGLTAGTGYRVYVTGESGTEMTPTPAAVDPTFAYGTVFTSSSSYVYPKVAATPNGNLYMLFWDNANLRYTVDRWSSGGASWTAGYANLTGSNIIPSGFDSFAFAVSSPTATTDNLHVVYGQGTSNMANTYDPYYGFYNGSSWTYTRMYDESDGGTYGTSITVDTNNKAYAIYNFTDNTGNTGVHLRYTDNNSAFPHAPANVQTNTIAAQLEIGKGFIVRDGTGTVTIVYGSEQDSWHMGYYLASSADGFAAKTLILDSCAVSSCPATVDNTNRVSWDMGNMVVDGDNKIHMVYTDTDITGGTNKKAYYRTNASGSWVTTQLTSSGRTNLTAYDIKINGSTIYVLMGSDSGYYLKAYNGALWYDGTLFQLDGYPRQFAIDPVSTRVMIAAELFNPYKVNYKTGLAAEFVTVPAPNNLPALTGTFTTAGAINDTGTISLFSGVTVTDADNNNVGVAITYTAANGTLTGTGLTGTAGNYTLTSTDPATATSRLRALVFNPTADQVAPGSSVTTTFTLTPNDGTANGTANSTTRVTVTSVNDAPVNTVIPAISGTAVIGNALTAGSGTWTDVDPGASLSYSYQWYRADDNSGTNEAAIAGATANTRTLISADAHKYLRVVVTANDGQGSATQTAASARIAVANSAPVNTAAPSVSGTTGVGSSLATTSGAWTDADGDTLTFSYQWYRADDNTGTNAAAILSATANAYTLASGDAHKYVRVVVTANDGSANQTAGSSWSAVANTAPVNTVLPSVSGTTDVGSSLATTSGTWTDADGDTLTFSYQWYRADDAGGTNAAAIPSATASSYVLTASDARKCLRVIVTANDGHGSSTQTASSAWTAPINSVPMNSAAPSVSGTTVVGNTLSATSGAWTDADGDTLTFSYQWYRADDNTGTNAAAIPGAAANSYTLASGDSHKYLRVAVTADDGHGSSTQTAFSAWTAQIADPPDTTDPVLTISTLPNNSYTNNASLNVSGTAADNVGIASLAISGVTVTVNADHTFSHLVTLVSGSNTVTTVAADPSGNTATDTRVIVLDQAAPGLTVNTPADNSYTNVPVTAVTGTVDETVQSVVVSAGTASVSAGMTALIFSAPTVTLSPGLNTLTVTATDLAGNTSSVSRSITCDTSAPNVAITNPPSDARTKVPTVTIQGTVGDALTPATATISIDGVVSSLTITAGAFSLDVTFPAEGLHVIIVTATDLAGNSAAAQRNINYVRYGDIDGNGVVDIVDALKALMIAAGLHTPTPGEADQGDVAPLVGGSPQPDGKIDIGDVVVLLRRAAGLVNW